MHYLQPGDLLTVRQVSEILGLTTKSIYGLIHNGDLVAVRFGRNVRVHRAELEKFVRVGSEW